MHKTENSLNFFPLSLFTNFNYASFFVFSKTLTLSKSFFAKITSVCYFESFVAASILHEISNTSLVSARRSHSKSTNSSINEFLSMFSFCKLVPLHWFPCLRVSPGFVQESARVCFFILILHTKCCQALCDKDHWDT